MQCIGKQAKGLVHATMARRVLWCYCEDKVCAWIELASLLDSSCFWFRPYIGKFVLFGLLWPCCFIEKGSAITNTQFFLSYTKGDFGRNRKTETVIFVDKRLVGIWHHYFFVKVPEFPYKFFLLHAKRMCRFVWYPTTFSWRIQGSPPQSSNDSE